ncbi:hypothetical protein GM3709_3375 [Geminocystis sp. NIES-3709]|nr:hypothetical protein GM3709_3375 [Geminocystis sp. NIES-3709]
MDRVFGVEFDRALILYIINLVFNGQEEKLQCHKPSSLVKF